MNPGDVDLGNPDLYVSAVPHEVFTWLRREDPVHWNPVTNGRGFWSVTKYDDIVAISKNPEVFSSAREHGGHRIYDENIVGTAGMGAEETDAPFISMDPPEHNRYRRMISPGFGPSRLKALEGQIHDRVCHPRPPRRTEGVRVCYGSGGRVADPGARGVARHPASGPSETVRLVEFDDRRR